MDLSALQSAIIKVMQGDYLDEKGDVKFPQGMQQADFVHLLNNRDKELPLLVDALVDLEEKGLVHIVKKQPAKGRGMLGKFLATRGISLTSSGRNFDTEDQGT